MNFPEADISETLSTAELLSPLNKQIDKCTDPKISPLYELRILLASMLLRNIAKKYVMIKMVKRQYSCYYDVVYKYSHKKMSKLLELRSFRMLFQHFTSSGGFEKMLEEDETLKANSDNYREKATEIQKYLI